MENCKIIELEDRGLIKFEYESNYFITKYNPSDDHPDYLVIREVFTKENDRNKGYFSENIKNMISYSKDRNLEGFIILKNESLSDYANNVIKTGLKNKWMIQDQEGNIIIK